MTTRWLKSIRNPALFVGFIATSACGRTVTPAELERYEAHEYAGHSNDEVYRATVVALKSLGYDVVSANASTGRVKTAPKLVAMHATGGQYHAVATSDGMAWTIDVMADGSGGSRVHAVPRLYSAGQSIEATRLASSYADNSFRTLYSEIESNLESAPVGRTTTTSSADVDREIKPSNALKKGGPSGARPKSPSQPKTQEGFSL